MSYLPTPITVNQGTAATIANAWTAKITDGTNTFTLKAGSTAAAAGDTSIVVALSPNSPLPAGTNSIGSVVQGTAAALSGFWPVKVTDGTNSMPTMDVVGRAGFQKVTDGTNTAAVKAASTAPLATDPALVVCISPNSPITVGTVAQGTAAALAGYWPVRITDGVNTMPTMDVAARAGFHKNTDGTNTAAVKAASTSAAAADPALVVALSPNFGATGCFPVTYGDPGTEDTFGHIITATRIAQILVPFYQSAPSNLLTITTSGGGATSQGLGTGIFSSGAATTGQVKGVSFNTVSYAAHYELYSAMTASFTTPTSIASYQRMGIYDAVNGFSFGYNGTTFGIWLRYNSGDTFIAQTSWNVDKLSGAVGSKFTSNGAPVALVPTFINLYRIRYGWLGIANVSFEVLAPDGNFVVVHTARFANAQNAVSITNPNLPLTVDISKTASDATNLIVTCGCWVGGTTAPGTTSILTGVGTISALAGDVRFQTIDQSALSFSTSGTWSGTLAFQYSLDGITWTSDVVLDVTTGGFVSSTTANQAFSTNVAAFKLYRVVATAWTSGTATVTFNGGLGTGVVDARTLITDAANNGPVAVKPASTAALATDPALVVTISPNSAGSTLAGTSKPLYGTNNQSLTITLASLANAAARNSTAVDNTSILYEDVLFFVKVTSNAAGTSATGYVNIYGYGTVDGGTTYPEGITGADAAVTLSVPPNLVLLAQIAVNANAKTYTAGPFSFCRMYGLPELPARWGVVVVNQSGAALGATNAITYQGINSKLA